MKKKNLFSGKCYVNKRHNKFSKTLIYLSVGICLFLPLISLQAQQYHSLNDDDVEVIDGMINSCNYNFNIKNIIIPATLDNQTIKGIANKNLQEGVFFNKGITSISLPITLVEIGDGAFANNSLNSLPLHAGLTRIGDRAFANNFLNYLTIPQGLTSVGDEAFANNLLVNINMPQGMTYIGNGAFAINLLTEVDIPNTITVIDDMAFTNNSLENITIPNSVTRIGKSTFSLNSLKSVNFESNSSIKIIDIQAFANNSDLAVIVLPTPIKQGFTNWIASNGTSYLGGEVINNFNLFYIAQYPYTLIDEDVVVVDSRIKSCNYSFEENSITIPSLLDNQTIQEIENNNYPNGVFYNRGITSVNLPAALTNIGDNALASNYLTNITIPYGVTIIGDNALKDNFLLTLTIPNNVTHIGEKAFANNGLNAIDFEANSKIKTIKTAAFEDNSNLSSMTLPTPITNGFINWIDSEGNTYNGGDNINEWSRSYTAQASYTLTNDDVEVQNGIIESCSYNFQANAIIIPTNLDGQEITRIAPGYLQSALFYDKNITSVVLPDSIETIGDYAFASNNLPLVELPSKVQDIKNYAFAFNILKNITLSSNVTNIGNFAFAYNSLRNMTIPKSVTRIGNSAFKSNSLNRITFEENSNIKMIEANAFANNSDLTSITLPTPIDEGFLYWKDNEGNTYNGGEEITAFGRSYTTHYLYTLTDEDVEVQEGIIQSCSYNFTATHIIIPPHLRRTNGNRNSG